jgi:very-short-patch-repair endonuclease
MPAAVKFIYGGRTFTGRSALAKYLDLSLPMLKKLLAREPRSLWQSKIDAYLRLQGRGPLTGIAATREEIQSFLKQYKPGGYLVALRDTPLYLNTIRADTEEFGVTSDSERLLCWLQQQQPPMCSCGQRRTFRSLEQGWEQRCGQGCPDDMGDHTFGRSPNHSSRPSRAPALLASLGIDERPLGDTEAIEAVRRVVATYPRHYVGLLQANKWLSAWITARSNQLPDDAGDVERIHVALTGESPFCSVGRRRSFRRLNDGYLFCAHQSDCPCATESKNREMRKTIISGAPPGYITASEWAQAHGLNLATVLNDIRAGRLPSATTGRYIFVPEDHPPPAKEDMVACAICGKTMMHISGTHLRKHNGMTVAEYRKSFRAPVFGARWWRRLEEEMKRIFSEMTEEERLSRFSSKAEDAFAAHLEQLGLRAGHDFLRQHPPLPDVPIFFDFFLPAEQIVVEIDGPHHWSGKWIYECTKGRTPEEMVASQRRADKARDTLAQTLGYEIFRVQVTETLDDVKPFRTQLRRRGFPEWLL